MENALPSWVRTAGLVVLILWAVVFLCGAFGELLSVPALREVADFKGLFLR